MATLSWPFPKAAAIHCASKSRPTLITRSPGDGTCPNMAACVPNKEYGSLRPSHGRLAWRRSRRLRNMASALIWQRVSLIWQRASLIWQAGVEKKSSLAELKLASGGQSAKGIEQQMGYTVEELHAREYRFCKYDNTNLMTCVEKLLEKIVVQSDGAEASAVGDPEARAETKRLCEKKTELKEQLVELANALSDSPDDAQVAPSPGGSPGQEPDDLPDCVKKITAGVWRKNLTVKLPKEVVGSGVFNLLRELPISRKLGDGLVCAIEALKVFHGVGIKMDRNEAPATEVSLQLRQACT